MVIIVGYPLLFIDAALMKHGPKTKTISDSKQIFLCAISFCRESDNGLKYFMVAPLFSVFSILAKSSILNWSCFFNYFCYFFHFFLDIINLFFDNADMNYPGGKGGVYQKLINLMPPHEVYIETHLGGGAVIRKKKPAKINIGIEIDPNTIEMWTRTSNKVDLELIHGDAICYLKSHHFTGKELVYCDPPYLRKVRKKRYPIYKYEYTIEQHEKLLEVINSLPCMVMISGYESSLYEKSLKDWHVHSFQAATHHGMATERIWMNYPPPVELHDYRYLGDNFRERERITNRTKRWMTRLRKMPVLERKALLSAISSLNEMN